MRSLPKAFAGCTLALFLGPEFKLLAVDRLGQGSAAACVSKPMRLIARGEKLGAVGFMLVHNDPGRSAPPTPEEYALTKEIRRAGDDFDVHLLDHLVIAGNWLMDIGP